MSAPPVAWYPNARVDSVSVADDKDTHTITARIVLNAAEPNCGILQTGYGSAEMAFAVVTDGSELIPGLPLLKDSTSSLGKTLQQYLSNLGAAQSI